MSILNITRGVLSRNENHLLFGANCSESSEIVVRYVHHLRKEIETIEKKTYSLMHNGQLVNARFYIAELPNDMKMVALLCGELSNSATYFSSYADGYQEKWGFS